MINLNWCREHIRSFAEREAIAEAIQASTEAYRAIYGGKNANGLSEISSQDASDGTENRRASLEGLGQE